MTDPQSLILALIVTTVAGPLGLWLLRKQYRQQKEEEQRVLKQIAMKTACENLRKEKFSEKN